MGFNYRYSGYFTDGDIDSANKTKEYDEGATRKSKSVIYIYRGILMEKRLIAVILVLMVLTACTANENVYSNDYITFNYPKDWDMKVNESISSSNKTKYYNVS